jgi:hypothetical protein
VGDEDGTTVVSVMVQDEIQVGLLELCPTSIVEPKEQNVVALVRDEELYCVQ